MRPQFLFTVAWQVQEDSGSSALGPAELLALNPWASAAIRGQVGAHELFSKT